MRHYALFGEHLGHSLSVPIHEAVFRRLGLQADYRLIELPREGFREAAEAAMAGLDGFNVTIPYKQDVMPLLARLDDRAARVGAVNTVTMADRTGHNTDVQGFTAMLRRAEIDPAGMPCWVLGTGGASKAVRVALEDAGAASIAMVSRHPEAGEKSYGELRREFRGLLVNCTPAGMYPHPEGCPVPPEALEEVLRRAEGVADLIYNPPETRLTAAARRMGIPACTGLPMLVAQAVEAESLWQGYSLPDELVDDVLHEVEGIL